MKLLLELGNSRLKAGLMTRNQLDYLGAYDYDDVEALSIEEALDFDEEIDSVYLCSVGQAELETKLIQKIKTEYGIFPHVLMTEPECCQIVCGYENFKQFGVDRWMAILGAAAYSTKPFFIVDAGTAIKVDVVVDGKHHGGFITPGLSLMRESLSLKTQNIELGMPSDTQQDLLAKNTQNAIHGGTLFMVVSYLNSLLDNLEQETGRKFTCIGTGGDFGLIGPLLNADFDYIEDLTLQGMVEVIKSV